MKKKLLLTACAAVVALLAAVVVTLELTFRDFERDRDAYRDDTAGYDA